MDSKNIIAIFRKRVPYLNEFEVSTDDQGEGLFTVQFEKEEAFSDKKIYLPIKDEDSGYIDVDQLSLKSELILNFFDAGEDEEKHLLYKLENSVPDFKKAEKGMNFGSIQKHMKLEDILNTEFSLEGNITDMVEEDLKTSNRVSYLINHLNKKLYQLDEFCENYLSVRFP